MDDCLRQCAGMEWFTLIDAKSAFWSIPLARVSRQSSAFLTTAGQFRWLRMPMGARCALKFFQRFAEFLAAPMDQTPSILCYMDDITLVTRESFEFNIAYIGKFLETFNLTTDLRLISSSVGFCRLPSNL